MGPSATLLDRAALDAAVELIDALIELALPTPDQEDFLETLSTLVEAYCESDEFLADVRGVEALRALLEANDMSASDLSDLLGDRSGSLGERVLRGEHELSKAHIKKLCARFAVSADLFV